MKNKEIKKKIYFNSSIGSLFVVLFFLALGFCGSAFCIYEWVKFTNPSIKWAFYIYPIFVIVALASFILFLGIIQFVKIDEEKIVSRCLIGKIGELKWQDVKEIRIKASASDKLKNEIVFVSKIVDFAIKDKPKDMDDLESITLDYTIKREQFVKQLKPDLEFIIEEDGEKINEIENK